jgi:hypothetical protein
VKIESLHNLLALGEYITIKFKHFGTSNRVWEVYALPTPSVG